MYEYIINFKTRMLNLNLKPESYKNFTLNLSTGGLGPPMCFNQSYIIKCIIH